MAHFLKVQFTFKNFVFNYDELFFFYGSFHFFCGFNKKGDKIKSLRLLKLFLEAWL